MKLNFIKMTKVAKKIRLILLRYCNNSGWYQTKMENKTDNLIIFLVKRSNRLWKCLGKKTCPMWVNSNKDSIRLCAVRMCVSIKWAPSKLSNRTRKIKSSIKIERLTGSESVPLGKFSFKEIETKDISHILILFTTNQIFIKFNSSYIFYLFICFHIKF